MRGHWIGLVCVAAACMCLNGACPPPDNSNESGQANLNDNSSGGGGQDDNSNENLNENGAAGNDNGGATDNANQNGNGNQNINENLNENDNSGGGTRENHAPVIEELSVPEYVDVGAPVEISWRVSDPDGDPLLVVISVDSEWRNDYLITDPAITSQTHVFTNAAYDQVRLRVMDGKTESSAYKSVRRNGPITITPYMPKPNRPWENPLLAQITVDSLYEVREAAATFEGQDVPMAYSTYCRKQPEDVWRWFYTFTCYEGVLDASTVVRGVYNMTFRVTDVLGNVAEQIRRVVIDERPLLRVSSPTPYSTTTGRVVVRGECSDDSGAPCKVRVNNGGEFEVQGAFEAEVGVSPYYGNPVVSIAISATDEWVGFPARVSVPVVIYDNANFTKVYEAPRLLLDLNTERAVCAIQHDVPEYDQTCFGTYKGVQIVDRTTGAVEDVPLPEGWVVDGRAAFITPTGAFFRAMEGRHGHDDECAARAFDWNTGELLMLGPPNDGHNTIGESLLRAAGDFGAWQASSDAGVAYVVRRKFSDRSETRIEQARLGDVLADGAILYVAGEPSQVFRYSDSDTEQLTNDPAWRYVNPRTDGNLVVFSRSKTVAGVTQYETRLLDGSGESTLSDAGGSYMVRGGWVAFTRPAGTEKRHVWLRAPDGAIRQLTYFTQSSDIAALAPNGEVLILTWGEWRIASPDGNLRDLGTAYGTPIWFDEEWHLMVGAALYRLTR